MSRVDEPPKITMGPREMSHWESDRTDRTAKRIDTDLDSVVLDYGDGTREPTLVTDNTATEGYQDATYTAMDQEDTDANLMWSLAGPDATRIDADGDEVPIFRLRNRPDYEPHSYGYVSDWGYGYAGLRGWPRP